MYKVFINQKAVMFISRDELDSQLINNKTVLSITGSGFPQKTLQWLLTENKQAIILACKNLNKVWQDFKKKFKVIKAGGGLVLNKKGELLFIFRQGKWDLPKGKQDKGERIDTCALREVKEECGIKQLKLDSFIYDSWHVYMLKEKPVLKQTSWFLMHVTNNQKLIPQADEGITKITFLTRKKYISTVRKKTYPLIADLINNLPPTVF